MRKKVKWIGKFLTALAVISFLFGLIVAKAEESRNKIYQNSRRHTSYGFYAKHIKRPLDFSISLMAIVLFWPVLAIIALMVRINLGSPVIFSQLRPGMNERIFKLHKFRSMADIRDQNGNLLPDEMRLTSFGKKMRNTSLDELPELFDILIGNLSIVGPRPQLVRDMVFMSNRYRKRHYVMPGLTGLAQINGRNAIKWEKKLEYDLEYMEKITFWGDLKIVLKTIGKVFVSRDGITENGMATATDYGDYLLKCGKLSREEYELKQKEAIDILERVK